jgi:predicted HicB family RNase H-like nuclease
MKERLTDVFRVASALFDQGPDWVVFFREVLGIGGVVRQVYRTPEELAVFERTEEYALIKQMLADLRRRADERQPVRESQRVITVRMPESLHDSLKEEAQQLNVSINQLCIAKLVKIIDDYENLPKKNASARRKKVGLEADL